MAEAAASLSHGHVPAAALRLLGDEALARRVAAGDGHAFAALYQRHHQALYRYCRAILGNSEDAADALQNTMAAALRALPGEQRELHIKPWLYRIAHNESITLARRRPPVTALDQAIQVPDTHGSDPATRERLRELFTDLQELQDRQRAALVMRELNGLSYEELGPALGASPAAAKQLVYEARSALHEMAEGRDMSCELVRTTLSADDGRKLRSRRFRAHLKACAGCRDFQRSMDTRRRDLAALAPPLPPLAAASILHALGGGGHAGTAGGLGGLVGGGTGKAVATSAVLKGVAAAAVVATVGTGTAGLTGNLPIGSGHDKRHEAVPPGARTSPAGHRTTAAPAAAHGQSRSERQLAPGQAISPAHDNKSAAPLTSSGLVHGRAKSHSTGAPHGQGLSHRPVTRRSGSTAKPHPVRRPEANRPPAATPPVSSEPSRGDGRKPTEMPAPARDTTGSGP